MKAKRTLWYLRGNRQMAAYRIGSPIRDNCGQTPWMFVRGKWAGQIVFVEPYKMKRGCKAIVHLS